MLTCMSTGLDRSDAAIEQGAMDDPCSPCPYRELRDLTRAISQVYEVTFAGAGLTATQHRLLSEIKRLKVAPNAELARAIGLDPSTLSRNLTPLVTRGWVRIEPGRDARTHGVLLTVSGRQRHAMGERQWRAAKASVAQQLGPHLVAKLYSVAEECLVRLPQSSAVGKGHQRHESGAEKAAQTSPATP